jgi:hypothetical protein
MHTATGGSRRQTVMEATPLAEYHDRDVNQSSDSLQHYAYSLIDH